MVDFPDVEKIYKSKELCQFLVICIPSPEQAEVEEILRREHIREDDAVTSAEPASEFLDDTVESSFDGLYRFVRRRIKEGPQR